MQKQNNKLRKCARLFKKKKKGQTSCAKSVNKINILSHYYSYRIII